MRIIKLNRSEDFLALMLSFKGLNYGHNTIMLLKSSKKGDGAKYPITYRALLAKEMDISCVVESDWPGIIEFDNNLKSLGFTILHGEGCIQEAGRRSND